MSDLIDLDVCVLNALDMLAGRNIPEMQPFGFSRPLVVGSGNAAVTGRIIFEHYDAVFADEGSFLSVIEKTPSIDGAVLISASGGKHAPTIAQGLRQHNLSTILLTNNPDSLASKEVDKTIVFPKRAEPYTYNTSTYLSMVMSYTGENPEEIKSFINQSIAPDIPDDLTRYDSYYIMVPERFDVLREMFLTKFDELFGSVISGRVFTEEQTKHAKTIVPSDTELFIGLGVNNSIWGTQRLNFEVPKNADHGAMISIGYYVIGQIQKQNPPFFKQNIDNYTKNISEVFGQKITTIVT